MARRVNSWSEVPMDWLLSRSEPWVILNTRLDLLGQPPNDAQVHSAYEALKKDARIDQLFSGVKAWPQEKRLSRAYDPKDSLWKVSVLADFGLRLDDKRVGALAKQILAAQAVKPAPPGFLHGGFDHTHSFDNRPYICISHVMTYALARFGYLEDARVRRAYQYLVEWQRKDGGWHPNQLCLPGNERQNEPSCPFGTVNVLRAIAANPSLRDEEVARRGVDFVLGCWERRAEPYRPIGFGIGTTFMKLQYPFVQYQLLKTVDTLANFSTALQDRRFEEMLNTVMQKRTPDGQFIPEAVNKPFADFDFGQKKSPSGWMTFVVFRAVHRLNEYQEHGSKVGHHRKAAASKRTSR